MRKFLLIFSIFSVVILAGCFDKADTNKPVRKEEISATELYAQLQEASKEGDIEKVRALIKQGVDVNLLVFDKTTGEDINDIEAQYEETPLMLASKNGHLGIVKELLTVGAKVNQILPVHTDRGMMPGEDQTALEMACRSDNIEVLKTLADAGTNAKGILICACRIGNEELLEIALKNKPDLDFTTGEGGVSPLIMAAEKDYENIVKALLDAGADPNYTDSFETDYTALKAAQENGNTEIVNILKAAGVQETTQKETQDSENNAENFLNSQLYEAVENNDEHLVKDLLQKGANPNVPYYEVFPPADTDDTTPLFVASKKGYVEIMKLLIQAGARVNETCCTLEYTPLIFAVQNQQVSAVKTLIDAGVDVNKKGGGDCDSSGETPLIYASKIGNVEIVQLLLQAGANVDTTYDESCSSKKDITALMEASRVGYTDITSFLIKAGANINAKDNQGNTALKLAQSSGHTEIVNILKAAGAKE